MKRSSPTPNSFLDNTTTTKTNNIVCSDGSNQTFGFGSDGGSFSSTFSLCNDSVQDVFGRVEDTIASQCVFGRVEDTVANQDVFGRVEDTVANQVVFDNPVSKTSTKKDISKSTLQDDEYQSNIITNCCIVSSDGRKFYISKKDLYYSSNVFKEALNTSKDDIAIINLDYCSTDVYTWLRTFCHTEKNNKILTPMKITQDLLHIIIPIYHQYDMTVLLQKCHIVIQKSDGLNYLVVKTIFETDGFKDKYNTKILNLISNRKIHGDYIKYIPKGLLLEGFLNKSLDIENVCISVNNWLSASAGYFKLKNDLIAELDKNTNLNIINKSI